LETRSQLLTLYITPVIYVYLDRLGERASHWRRLGGTRKAISRVRRPPSGAAPTLAE
jgi:hypothetical protein